MRPRIRREAALVPVWIFLLTARGGGLFAQEPPPAPPQLPPPVAVRYRIDPLPRDLRDLEQRFTPGQIDVIEQLNRRDREHVPRVEPKVPGLVVPLDWPDNELSFSPFPLFWREAAALGKVIVVDQQAQAFAAYADGGLVRWGAVSTGRKDTPTPVGTFHLTWKAKERRSTDNAEWLLRWYFNFVNARGVSFHEFELPGYPASHACVRLLPRDAEWLYRWGDQWVLDDTGANVLTPGTTVIVRGTYSTPPPWTSLDWLAKPIALPPAPR